MMQHLTYPLVIAHRGCRAAYPENTLAAFEGAVAAGAPMMELDVTLSRDRQVVVMHDDSVNRTTDGSGTVRNLTLSALKRLDAGAWFHSRFAGERIPTLAEVLDGVGRRILINIEIKPEAFEPADPPDAIERQVAELVQARHLEGRVLLSSFESRVLARLAERQNSPALAVLSERPGNEETRRFCTSVRAVSWHPDFRCLDRDQVAMMQEAGLRVFPYTVNDPAEMKKVLHMGVDGLITDDPVLAREVCRHL